MHDLVYLFKSTAIIQDYFRYYVHTRSLLWINLGHPRNSCWLLATRRPSFCLSPGEGVGSHHTRTPYKVTDPKTYILKASICQTAGGTLSNMPKVDRANVVNLSRETLISNESYVQMYYQNRCSCVANYQEMPHFEPEFVTAR